MKEKKIRSGSGRRRPPHPARPATKKPDASGKHAADTQTIAVGSLGPMHSQGFADYCSGAKLDDVPRGLKPLEIQFWRYGWLEAFNVKNEAPPTVAVGAEAAQQPKPRKSFVAWFMRESILAVSVVLVMTLILIGIGSYFR